MKKILFYVLVIIMAVSMFSCTASKEKIDEKAYVDKMTNLGNNYTPILHEVADAIRAIYLGGTGIVYEKEILKEFIKLTRDDYKIVNELTPPEKYKKCHSYTMEAFDNALKIADHFQKYIDTDNDVVMKEEMQAASEDIQDCYDYFALAAREEEKVER